MPSVLRVLSLALAAIPLATASTAALAQAWPAARPIRLVVPYPAGGGTDFFARLMATKIGENLGQSVVVENRPGASSIVGAEFVAKSAPDGYTMIVGDNATYAVNPFLYAKLPYDPLRDFAPVTRTMLATLMLGVPGDSKITNVTEFVAAVKAREGQFAFGSPGPGTPHHLAMEAFLQANGVKANHIPYKGGAPAFQDLVAGRLEGAFIDLGTAGSNIKSGKVRVLGIGNKTRLAALPEVPTIAEAGVSNYEAAAWQGFAFPAGTPAEIVNRMAAEYAKVALDPQIRQKMADVGFEPTPSTPAEFIAHIKAEQARWSAVIRAGSLKLD